MIEQTNFNSPTRKNGVFHLIVSLYLFLLIFFVLLNSSYKPSKKFSKAIMNSMQSTFANGKNADYSEDISLLPRTELIESLKRYYSKQLKTAVNKDFTVTIPDGIEEGLVQVSLPMIDFFEPNSYVLQPKSQYILADIALIMNNNLENIGLKVSICATSHGYLDDASKSNIDLMTRRQSEIAATLVRNSVESEVIQMSLEQGDRPNISLIFALNLNATPE